MGLAIGMYKGDAVQVGESTFKLIEVLGLESFKIVRCKATGEAIAPELVVNAKEAKELDKGAFISAGIGTHGMARVVIEAPREIEITRLGNVDNARSIS